MYMWFHCQGIVSGHSLFITDHWKFIWVWRGFEEGLKRGYTVKIQDEQCIGNRKGICGAKSGINKACVILLSVMLAYGSKFYPPFGNASNLKIRLNKNHFDWSTIQKAKDKCNHANFL